MSQRRALETFAPCRISPVGAHTDHQGGLTLGLALSEGVHFRGAIGGGVESSITSAGFEGTAHCTEAGPGAPLWQRLLAGLHARLAAKVALPRGIEGALTSDLPSGGVATSAAVQIAVARAFLAANALDLSNRELMDIVRENERAVTGAPVGLLDPAVILEGGHSQLVVIDCQSGVVRRHRFARTFPLHEWSLVDVGVPRTLGETPYAVRVGECASAARALGAEDGLLSSADLPALRKRRGAMSPECVKRAEHYFAEVRRVRLFVSAAAEGDFRTFATLINASADSLTHLFEVGVPETVRALSWLRTVPGVAAATYAGGGFGGQLLVLHEPGSGGRLAAACGERGGSSRLVHAL